MKMKKVLAATLAMATLSAVAGSVSAAFPDVTIPTGATSKGSMAADSNGEYGASFKVSATYSAPSIQMAVPTGDLTALINPYRLDVKVAGGTAVKDQVLSTTQLFENLSPVDIKVDVTATATVGTSSDMKLATSAPKAGDTKKDIFLAVVGGTGATEPTTWAYDAKAKNGVLPTAKGATGTLFTLKASTDGSTAVADGKGYAKVIGSTADSCTTWKATDTVDIALVYKFVPLANAASNS